MSISKRAKSFGAYYLREVIMVKIDRCEAFDKLPKLLQVSMVHSGALPHGDEAVQNMANKLEGIDDPMPR